MDSLIEHLIQVAKDNPSKEAIVCPESSSSISYSDLVNAIQSLANWLRKQGFSAGDRIGVLFPNSIEYVVCYYACWSAGYIPVGLNSQASTREWDFWVSQSDCQLLLKHSNEVFGSEIQSHVVCYSDGKVSVDKSDISDAGTSSICKGMGSKGDVATIIYTSGTTGNPKGITLSHKNLLQNSLSIIASLKIHESDKFLCVLPFFYSYGNSVLHTHLASGATLVLLNQVIYPRTILEYIERYRCTGFAGVPSLYISLLKRTDFSKFDLSSLRYVSQAGGPLASESIGTIKELLSEIDFVVMYGQTEAAARIAYLPPEKLMDKLGSVGIGIPGVKISVRSESGVECEVGEVGEICVRGDNVMIGYWENPEATSRVLKNNELYTGDMGYLDSDGFLYIKGRQSEILKISEHRVSPSEIEEVVLKLGEVDECAVIGCPHSQMGQVAKAFVVTNSEISSTEIKKHCAGLLAKYKIPKEIEFVSAVPKTSSGKIKRNLLAC